MPKMPHLHSAFLNIDVCFVLHMQNPFIKVFNLILFFSQSLLAIRHLNLAPSLYFVYLN